MVNLVAGPGEELGRALISAAPVRAVSFTGSCAVGQWVHGEAAKRRLRVQLEMGGKNPTIVLEDADLDLAVENVVNGAFASTGQKSTATSRAIVEESIYEPLHAGAGGAHGKLRAGNAVCSPGWIWARAWTGRRWKPCCDTSKSDGARQASPLRAGGG